MTTENCDYKFKILLLGDPHVGKTSMMHRYVENKFQSDYTSTLGIKFLNKKILLNNKIISLSIWDVAGQGKWTSFKHIYYKGTQFVIFIFDVINRTSFLNLPFWINDFKEKATIPYEFGVIVNKIDLENRVVSYRDLDMLKSYLPDITFVEECSAKTGRNVEKVFNLITKTLIIACGKMKKE